MVIAAAVLTVLLGSGFVFAGSAKVRHAEPVTSTLDRLGVRRPLQQFIGVVEVLGGIGVIVGLWFAPLGIFAAAGLVLTMLGALAWHAKEKDSVANSSGALILLVLGAAVLTLQSVTI